VTPVGAETRYALSGDVHIAYQVTGEGPFDLVFVPGFVTHMELQWKLPGFGNFLNELGSVARLIRFDKRGTGMSDPVTGAPTLETRMDDVRAVMDAVGSKSRRLLWNLRRRESSRRKATVSISPLFAEMEAASHPA
jgi:pimeloyl-ACP methyl ester carboxylesterase